MSILQIVLSLLAGFIGAMAGSMMVCSYFEKRPALAACSLGMVAFAVFVAIIV